MEGKGGGGGPTKKKQGKKPWALSRVTSSDYDGPWWRTVARKNEDISRTHVVRHRGFPSSAGESVNARILSRSNICASVSSGRVDREEGNALVGRSPPMPDPLLHAGERPTDTPRERARAWAAGMLFLFSLSLSSSLSSSSYETNRFETFHLLTETFRWLWDERLLRVSRLIRRSSKIVRLNRRVGRTTTSHLEHPGHRAKRTYVLQHVVETNSTDVRTNEFKLCACQISKKLIVLKIERIVTSLNSESIRKIFITLVDFKRQVYHGV